MTQNVGDIEYVIKADTSQLLRADKEVNDATSSMESGFKRTDKAAEKTGKAIVRAADDASDAAKIIERLGNEIAILEEANEGGAKSASIFAAQLAASGDASQKQKEEIGALAGKLYDLRAAVKEAAKASSELAKQSSKQASEADRLRSITQGLSKQIAVLKEEQRNGARSAAMLSARLQAGSNATAAQRREIGELAGKLYDLKSAQDQASRSSSGLKTGLTAIASAITISQLVRYGKQFLEVADAMTQLQARIDRLSPSAEEGRKTFSALAEMASVSGTSLADTEKLWETLTSSLQSAGASNGQILQLTDTLQKIGKIGGSSTQEMANALRQFGQSIASGTVRAQEFNSIVEQMPELARQIAAGMGISMDELRKLMLDGKLSAEDSLNAIMKQAGKVNDQFTKLPRSVEQATNTLSISFQTLVSEINDTTDASTTMVSVIDSITTAIEKLSGKVPTATQQIADLRSEAEMYARRARTWGWLGFGDWQKENEGRSAKLTAEAWEKSSRAGWDAAQNVAKNSKPIKIKTTTESTEKNGSNKAKNKSSADAAAEAISRQKAALDRLNTGYADGSLELAKYDAVVALGNKASAEQIAKAEQQAESIWKVQQATKAATEEERKRTQAGQNFTGLQGQVSPVAAVDNTYAQQMAQLDEYVQLYPQKIAEAEAVRAGIEDQYHQKRMAAMWEEWQQQSEINNMLGAAIDSLQGGATNAITGLINGTQSLQEAFANIGTTILNSVVGSLVQMGIEWVKSQLMGQAAAAASLASTMAQATAAASAWAPAAMSASIATYGSAAAVGQAAYAESLLAAKGMALAGGRRYGGTVSAGNAYRVNEDGRSEIFQTAGGQQIFMPNQSGKVISADKVGGGASFNPVMNLTINTTGGIGSEDIARLRKAWSNDMLKMMVDQSTRPGGLLQGRKK
ncbi:tape measure protein [Salmonella enterica subsp. enterica serovar Give]|nr:tape measure protein [Salmonella enterica subsp. enterica serovar Give]ECM4408634.1 tape measure protein [Salmonella enterica subsp. enterica serovar Give]EED4547589.1 tape measure protein [Salmonella enterica subsp. enterica serovar Give]